MELNFHTLSASLRQALRVHQPAKTERKPEGMINASARAHADQDLCRAPTTRPSLAAGMQPRPQAPRLSEDALHGLPLPWGAATITQATQHVQVFASEQLAGFSKGCDLAPVRVLDPEPWVRCAWQSLAADGACPAIS